MKKILIIIVLTIFLSGCATVNFSSKYYTPPSNYKEEIDKIWNNVKSKITLKYSYTYKICSDKETKLAGIPQIFNYTVYLPEYFINYVYQYFYNDRQTILTCVILHELAHTEFNIADNPPETHYLCDKYALENFIKPINYDSFIITTNDFYSSFIVVEYYWYARKGLGGNLFNATWMTVNLASIAYTGIASAGDLFEVDIATRRGLLRKDYPHAKFIFKRSSFQRANK